MEIFHLLSIGTYFCLYKCLNITAVLWSWNLFALAVTPFLSAEVGKKSLPPAEKATCESEGKVYQNLNSAGGDYILGRHVTVKK